MGMLSREDDLPATANQGMLRQFARQRAANPRPDVTDFMGYGNSWEEYGQNFAQNASEHLDGLGTEENLLGPFGFGGMLLGMKPKQLRLPLRYPAVKRGPIVYHGSPERTRLIPDPAHAVETSGATFLASNPNVADTFTLPREYGEPVFYDEAGREIIPGRVSKLRVNLKKPKELTGGDAQRFIDDTTYQGQVVDQARREGFDGIIARDVLEGIGERYRGDVYAVFDKSVLAPVGAKTKK